MPQPAATINGPATRPGTSRSAAIRGLLFPFIMVTVLFFLWGFCHAMLDVLNKHFQQVLQVSVADSTFIQMATYGGYFLMAMPAGWLVRRFGYKGGILVGLGLVATGAFLFIPAGKIFLSFPAFLAALFVLFCGLACLETAANPYITVLGPKETAGSRLVLSQSFNAVGWILGPIVGGMLIFAGGHQATTAAATASSFDSLMGPYITLGVAVAVIWVIFALLKLPEVTEAVDPHGAPAAGSGPIVASDRPLFRRPHFTCGVAAQFFYVAAQTCVGAMMLNCILANADQVLERTLIPFISGNAFLGALYGEHPSKEQAASFLVGLGMLCFALGRFSGSALLRVVRPHVLLALYGIVSVAMLGVVMADIKDVSFIFLVGSFLFLSIMFPTIFALSLRDLGDHTKFASSALVMSIVGGAVVPWVMGQVIKATGGTIATGYIVPLVCLLFVAGYGLSYPRLLARSSRT